MVVYFLRLICAEGTVFLSRFSHILVPCIHVLILFQSLAVFSMFAYILIFSDVFFSKPYSWWWLSTCERIKEIFLKHFQVNVHAHFGYWLIIWNKIFFRMLIYCVVGVYTFFDIIHKSDVESWRLSCIYIYIWLNSSG